MPASPYILRLRQAIGNALIFVPAVSVLVMDGERVLLVHEVEQDAWSTPGGQMEIDERPEDAARREVLEETGLDVTIDELVTALGGPEFRVCYRNGDEIAYVTIVYRGRVLGGAPHPDGDEVTAVDWFPIDSLHEVTLNPFAIELVRSLGWLPSPPA